MGLATFLVGFGLFISWSHAYHWLQALWYICQRQLEHLSSEKYIIWQLIVPIILLFIIIRGGLSIYKQVRATIQFTRIFEPLQCRVPQDWQPLLTKYQLQSNQVVVIDLQTPHAFCVGFLKPKIWLTTSLAELLTDEEFEAVLAHEVHHLRNHDPLQLVISRMLKNAFFFLPIAHDLAKAIELQQEVAADKAAITVFGDDLPLLCALQKLIKGCSTDNPVLPISTTYAAIATFNVTEARIRRLIYPPAPIQWRYHIGRWLVTSGVFALLTSIALMSAQAAPSDDTIIACTTPLPEPPISTYEAVWSNYNNVR